MTQYEYVYLNYHKACEKEFQRILTLCGKEGWRLVTSTVMGEFHHFYLEREINERT